MSQDSDNDDITRSHLQLSNDTLIGHYRIIGKIGAGGMGEVYLAEDTELNRKVALKFLPPDLCRDADCRVRFEREAQAAAKLNHSHIITIFDVGEFADRPFFAMEYIDGVSLDEYIRSKKLSWPEIIDLSIQIAEGLGEAHRAGIIHRDIKPSNILVDNRGRAKILDFGLAAIKGEKKLTKTGSTVGTLNYMSPEQTRGETLDERSDIFSFGAVLYEMITGQIPFRGDYEPAIMYAIAYEEPEPLARFKSGVTNDLQGIVNKALAKDKHVRYQQVDELLADLRRAIATVDSVPSRRKARARIVIPSLIVLGLLAAVLVFEPWKFLTEYSGGTVAAKRVVVVPFRNQTGDPSLDVLGRMIADWTTQGLLESGLADVVPPERLSQFERSMNIESIVKSTSAKTIVIGTYYKLGDTIQFQAQIFDAEGTLLQAIDPIKSQAAETMDGVESVRQHVLGALAFVLDTRLQKPVMRVSKPPRYEAYQEYIQGLDLFSIKEDYPAAIEHLNRASALDTSFVLPPLVACAAYVNLIQWPQADSLAKILDHHRVLLSQIQQLALDELEGIIAGDWLKTLQACREEVKLAPETKSNYASWALAALQLNRPRECIEALSAIDIRDTSIHRWDYYWDLLTYAYHVLGQHKTELGLAEDCRKQNPEKSIALKCGIRALAGLGKVEEVKKLVEEGRTFPIQPGIPEGPMIVAGMELRAHGYETEAMNVLGQLIRWYQGKSDEEKRADLWHYGYALYAARRWSEAKDVFAELVKLRPDIIEFQYYRTRIAARLGNREEAMKISDSLKNVQQPYLFGGPTYCRASIAAILGDKEQSISLLKESFLQGHDRDLHIDFDFESMKDYPPLLELIQPKG